MKLHDVDIPLQRIAEFCRRNQIAKLSLFGSILTADFDPGSDVDVLVEFVPGQGPGLFRFAGMEMELSGLLSRTVHLCTPADLSEHFRDKVLREARVQYAA